MIISASRRTDIPAFFGDWFMKRIEAGHFDTINPFTKQPRNISLLKENVDAIVFWTKNPEPFLQHIETLTKLGYNFYFQFTLNAYSKTFEPNVPVLERRIKTFQVLSKLIGKEKVIWRYDPIILGSETPALFHIDKIASISEELKGYTDRLTISFLDFYGKVQGNMTKLYKDKCISTFDILNPSHSNELHSISDAVKTACAKNNMEAFTCAESFDFIQYGIKHGSCIDGLLINKLFNLQKPFKKDASQRKECLCSQSVDMGVYNTCNFKCTYCYANSPNDIIAIKQDINSRSLF